MTSPACSYPDLVEGTTVVGDELDAPRTWSGWHEARAIVSHPPHLRRTIGIAFVVGTILVAINQLDVVLRGEATPAVWVKVALTYVVPFCSSNLGVLAALRRPPTEDR